MKTIIAAAVLAGAGLGANQSMAACGPTQQAAAADSLRHRWTIGLRYAGDPNFYGFGHFLPTVGYQWHPRWSVELGASYWRGRFEGSSVGFTMNGATVEYRYQGQSWWATVPIRVRYTLTRKAERRLQFDALGSVALSFARGNWQQTQLENAVEISRSQSTSSSFYGLAGLGLGGRYGLGQSRRLELLAELTAYQELISRTRPDYGFRPQRSFEPVGYWGLGLRYKL